MAWGSQSHLVATKHSACKGAHGPPSPLLSPIAPPPPQIHIGVTWSSCNHGTSAMQVRVHEVYTVQSTSYTHSCRGVKCTYASLAPKPHLKARGSGMVLVCMVVVSPTSAVFTSPFYTSHFWLLYRWSCG